MDIGVALSVGAPNQLGSTVGSFDALASTSAPWAAAVRLRTVAACDSQVRIPAGNPIIVKDIIAPTGTESE